MTTRATKNEIPISNLINPLSRAKIKIKANKAKTKLINGLAKIFSIITFIVKIFD